MIDCSVSGFLRKIKDFLLNYKDEISIDLLEKAFYFVYSDIVSEFLNHSDMAGISNGSFQTIVPHAYYSRPLFFMNFNISVRITRVRCDDGSTHAVLLSFMIPYSKRTTCDYIAAIEEEESEINGSLDNYQRTFLKWLFNRFLSLHLGLRAVSVAQLSFRCLKELNLQFMQFRSTPVFPVFF